MPVRMPAKLAVQAVRSRALDTKTQPVRLRETATSLDQSRRSFKNHQPSKAVNPDELYARTVEIEAPFNATESVHSELKMANTNP